MIFENKPYHGYIDNWTIQPWYGGGKIVIGRFRDHPTLKGKDGHTSYVVDLDEEVGIVETKNSIYHLGTKREQD